MNKSLGIKIYKSDKSVLFGLCVNPTVNFLRLDGACMKRIEELRDIFMR